MAALVLSRAAWLQKPELQAPPLYERRTPSAGTTKHVSLRNIVSLPLNARNLRFLSDSFLGAVSSPIDANPRVGKPPLY